jgi:DNA-binding beta-propeller fold protein YncE
MANIIKTRIIFLFLSLLLLAPGCFKEIVETREPLPSIIWPKPPAVARIRFINSISKPEDLNIRPSFSRKLLNFVMGETKTSVVNPYGITTDPEGRLYVVDTNMKHVHVFDQKNNEYYMFPDKDTQFTSPIDIVLDNKGSLYVSDSKEAVVKVFKQNGKKYVKDIGKGLLNRPTGLAFNKKTEELLVLDTKNNEIVRYEVDTLTETGVIGREGSIDGTFFNPTNISTSSDGNIYVSDSLNFRIQIFTPEGNFIHTFGKPGDSPGFFSRPKGVAVDSDGNIYVVDALFDNIQIFDSQGILLMDFGRPGSKYGDFWLPTGIYIDENDRIYVADSFNNRVQIFQYIKGE